MLPLCQRKENHMKYSSPILQPAAKGWNALQPQHQAGQAEYASDSAEHDASN